MGSLQRRSDDGLSFEPVIEALSSQLSDLKAHVIALENKVHQLEAKEAQRVIFTATITEGNIPAAPGQVIPFSTVFTNIGNAYDAKTSTFTVPYDGEYMVFVTVDVSPDYMRIDITKNGFTVLQGHNDSHDNHIYAGGAITLKAGDKLTITHDAGVIGLVDGGPEAVFSGFKI